MKWLNGLHNSFQSKSLKTGRILGVEFLEDRRLMASGAILYDVNAGRITIEGTDLADTVAISVTYAVFEQVSMTSATATGTATTGTTSYQPLAWGNFDWHIPLNDTVHVELRNTGSPLLQQFSLNPSSLGTGGVREIVFNGYGGNDFIDNNSVIMLRAYGGNGRDVLLGGSANDSLMAGEGNDFVDGRLGHDWIWGEGGSDALFGDDGYDLILGGLGNDFIHGGNDPDSLYGEGDNDWLFGGGAPDDILNGGTGTNRLYQDYGVTNVIVNGFETFDWFDRNLQDPRLRSFARLNYRDASLQRSDMLGIYSTVARDGLVSTQEFSDLQDLTSTNLTIWESIRNLASKVVNGNPANQTYQGGALGNLTPNASGIHLNRLVDKWFMGGDLPIITGTNGYAYVAGSLFQNGIMYTDVDQGGVGDCYFMAALGEVAQHTPHTILNMFTDNGDGTFMVRFFNNGVSDYVTVNRFLPVDGRSRARFAGWGGGQASNTGNELWVALAEKAYAQINESGWIEQDNTNSYEGLDLGRGSLAIKHISGKTASVKTFSSMTDLINAQNDGKAVLLSTLDTGTAANIVPDHLYTLVSYNSTTKRFELFNPHNDPASTTPTTLFLTWNELRANFTQWITVKL